MITEYLGENHLRFKSMFPITGFCLDCDDVRWIDERGLCAVCKSKSVIPHGSREGLEYNLSKEKKEGKE